jgi:hypothetical protein
MTTSTDPDRLAQERATYEGMPEAHNRALWAFTGETMDTQEATETIQAALTALENLERALDGYDRATVDAELWTARRELLKLLKMFETQRSIP